MSYLFVLQEEGEDTASSLSTPSSDPVDRESEGAVAEHVSPVSRDEYTGSIAYRAEMKHLAKQDENKHRDHICKLKINILSKHRVLDL